MAKSNRGREVEGMQGNEGPAFDYGFPIPGVKVEGPGADGTHTVAHKFKGDAVDTVTKRITPLGEQQGR